MMANIRPHEVKFKTDAQYHQFECDQCGKTDKNTYVEPIRTEMRERQLCYTCNYWLNFEKHTERDHKKMTIINGHIYKPGGRTSGEFRGMGGRRFDIEYIEPSEFAGKRITTFDLWAGSAMPEHLATKFPDTAKFLGGAEKVEMTGRTRRCWNPSSVKGEIYPNPQTLGLK